ncbi:MAG: alkylation response protein AidB-like acyl-CoA dehydrogenase [Candidatus Promineifilaceae bacterium]|jgi:alkylation response protein AidB-like acyl-CoA dehydrogenase
MNFDLTDEQREFRHVVQNFMKNEVAPMAHHTDETGEFNWVATKKMADLGLKGLQIPEEYGGAEMDTVSATIATEELARACGSTSLAISAHNCLGMGPINDFGTLEQKEKWLPLLTSKEGRLGCLTLTEPGAGSDLRNIKTKAELINGKWVFNGSKMWATNAGIAETMVVLTRTDGDSGSSALSHILVPTDTPGVIIGPPEKKMGLNGSPTHLVTFDNARVPAENLIGERGKGLTQTLSTLTKGRISIGSLALGLAQAGYDHSIRYAHERETMGKPIGHHQAVAFMLADMATYIQGTRHMIYWSAWLKDQGRPYAKEASMAKLMATETAEKVCYNAIQIHGGFGYSREFPVERIYRDQRLMAIGEGTSEILRMVIGRHLMSA